MVMLLYTSLLHRKGDNFIIKSRIIDKNHNPEGTKPLSLKHRIFTPQMHTKCIKIHLLTILNWSIIIIFKKYFINFMKFT